MVSIDPPPAFVRLLMLALVWKSIPMVDHLHQWVIQITAGMNIHHSVIHDYLTHDARHLLIWPTLKFKN